MSIVPQLIINSIIAGSIYSLVALGFNLTYSTTKFFNLAHGALCAVGGYMTFFFTKLLGFNLFIGITFGVGVAGILGYLLDIFIYNPLRKKKASNMILLVASLGAFTVIQAVLAILFSSQFQTISSSTISPTLTILGGTITYTQLLIFITAIIIMFLLALFLKFTMFGKAVKAISDDEEVAKIIGINTSAIISKVFLIGSMIAGLAGIFVGLDTGIEPTMGMSLLLKGAIASIIGGIGSVYGGVVGSFFLGIVENFGIWQISGEWKDAIAFTVFIIFLIFRPQGIFNK